MSELNKEMEKPEFLAALKLVSGEEILSVVTHVNDENGDYLIVENPIEIEEVLLQGNKQGAKVSPWMKFSKEEEFIIPKGYGLVRNYTGHGIGRSLHEPPQVPNFGAPGSGPKLIPGMTLAIEPMVNLGGEGTKLCDDGWTVVTSDGAKSAHFENTVLITDSKPEVLTS